MYIYEKLKYLENECGFKIIELDHAYRVNGTVDIYKKQNILYVKPENKDYEDIPACDHIDFIKSMVEKYPNQQNFKNKVVNKHGITYQEFKHMMRAEKQKPDSFNGADYHWNNNLEKQSDNHLYFIFHSNTVKIGQTMNIYNRIAQLKTALSDSFFVVTFFNKGFLEPMMHKAFIEFRKNGEWFKDNEVIRAFIKKYWSNKIGQSIQSKNISRKRKRRSETQN